jgi:iron(III) transport system substrate-binding protein
MKKSIRHHLLASAVATLTLGLCGSALAQARTTLTVYTALEADQIKAYEAAFEKAQPSIDLVFVRDSTGIMTAKLLAEKANPRADVVWGLAASSLAVFDKEGMLLGYAPKGMDKIKANMRDAKAAPTWVGMNVYASAMCFNTIEAGKKNLPQPKSWADLTNAVYKGGITMPHPASSGTGYLMVAAWLQMMGEEKGWAFMDALHQNVGVYTHSGSKPCTLAGAGEYPIGLSFEYRANKLKTEGAPINVVLPSEGLGWELEATGILKTTKHMDAAKALADWAASREASEYYAKNFAIVAQQGVQPKLEHIPANIDTLLAKNDFAWSAANRERILAEWSKRYEAKAEKR